MKGQSELLEYVLTIFFSLIVLLAVSAIIYTFYRNALTQDATKSLNQVALQVSDSILKIYQQGKQSTASPPNASVVLIASVDLNLPTKISGKNYEIDLIPINPLFSSVINFTVNNKNILYTIQPGGAKIIVKTTEDPIIMITKDLPNIDVNFQGTTKDGLNATLNYYRYNYNGTVYDKILLGNQPFIIDITRIS